MRIEELRRIRADLQRSYMLLGLMVLILGGVAALLVRQRAAELEKLHHIDSAFHLRTMVLCAQVQQHLLETQVDLTRDAAWSDARDDTARTSRRLARQSVEEARELHREFKVAAVTKASERLLKAQRALDARLDDTRGPQLDPYVNELLGRARLRAEQLHRLHQQAHEDNRVKLARTTQTWLWKLTGLAGLALLVGAIVVWRILDRSERAILSWRDAERERVGLYKALDAGASEAYLADPQTLAITFASRGASSALGIPNEKLRQMRLTDVAPELDEEQAHAVASSERGPLTLEARHRRADGTTYPVQVSLQRTEQNRADRLLMVAMDVSDLHDARTALEQAQKIEAAGQVAGGLAHDFNNLIMVIEGHAELLRMQRSTPALRAISEASARAGALTKQLLQFSRRSIVQPIVLDLNHMLTDVKYLLERLINANITTRFVPATEPVVVHSDRGQVQQIILNLCINAQDAMPEGGELTISTGWARRSEQSNPGWVQDDDGDHAFLRVRDTGHGMDAATLARVFEPFFTTKPVGRGTGLGLASVHSIVSEQDGHVEVESAIDEGACFTVYLPRCDEVPAEHHRDRDDPTDDRGSETILAVDDDDLVADLIEDVLRRKGYRVLVASTPGEALDIIEREGSEIRLLITDLVMPEMTGYELAERVTEAHPHMGVIYISGYAPERVVPERRLEEDITFLQKPFPPRDLVRATRDVLDANA